MQELDTPGQIELPAHYAIADTETCGLGALKIPCEVAMLRIDPVTLEVIGEHASLIDPEIEIPEATTAIHGITNAMVADEPTMAEFIEHRLDGGFKGNIAMICHNAPFDVPLLTGIGSITQTLCTLALARQYIRDTPNHKLQTLRAHYGFPENEAHRALADCYTTLRLLRKIVEITGKSLHQLLNAPTQAVQVMPWGQHKGKLIMQIPMGYLQWLYSRPDLDTNLRTAVQKAMKLK